MRDDLEAGQADHARFVLGVRAPVRFGLGACFAVRARVSTGFSVVHAHLGVTYA